MSRLFVTLIVVVMVVSAAMGDSIYFNGDGDAMSWNDVANWDLDRVPASGDNAYAGYNQEGHMTVVSGNSGVCNILRMANDYDSSLTIEDGASFDAYIVRPSNSGTGATGILNLQGTLTSNYVQGNASDGLSLVNQSGASSSLTVNNNLIIAKNGGLGIFNLSGGNVYAEALVVSRNGDGLLNVTGGTVDTTTALNIKQPGTGTGHVQLDGGQINAAELLFGGQGTMDITEGTLVLDDADGSVYDQVETWVTAGDLSGYGMASMDNVQRVWDSQEGTTTVTAIPEPATLALLGLGGASVLINRRKK